MAYPCHLALPHAPPAGSGSKAANLRWVKRMAVPQFPLVQPPPQARMSRAGAFGGVRRGKERGREQVRKGDGRMKDGEADLVKCGL